MAKMTRSVIAKWKTHCIVLVVVFAVIFFALNGKDKPRINRKCFPVPIKVGDEKVISSIYLELDFIQYNKPFDEFAKTASTEEEEFIRDTFKMLAGGDIIAANRTIVHNSTIDNNSSIKATPEKILSFWKEAFEGVGISDDLSNMVIGSCFFWRNLGIVTFASDKMEKERILAITFERQDDKLVMTMSWPRFSHLINAVGRQFYSHPKLLYNRGEIQFNYSFTFNKEDIEHPATLLFKGKQYNVAIPSDQIKEDDEAAYFYQQVISDFKNASTAEDIRKLADHFNEHNRNKLLGWIEKKPELTLAWPKEAARRDIQLEFIIDADPVYLIYITPLHVTLAGDAHDYILRKEDGFEVIRLSQSDDLSGILGGSDFRKPFLESLSNNKGN